LRRGWKPRPAVVASPFGIQNRITPPFAHDGKDVQWVQRGRVDHDLVVLAPPVELTWGLSIS
jgi:hypothetical protein